LKRAQKGTLLFVIAALCSVARVSEAAHPLVQLRVDACVAAPEAEVRRYLEIELGATLADAASAAETTVAALGCQQALTRITIDDPITGKSLSRNIDLSTAEERARSRLLAIAIYELISASWTELEMNPRPQVKPAGPAASPLARQAALDATHERTPPRNRYELDAIAGGRGWWSGAGFLGGGGLRVTARFRYHLGVSADVMSTTGRVSTQAGQVRIADVSGQASFVFHQDWSHVSLLVGAGLRVGGAYLSGSPTTPANTVGGGGWGTWLGPLGSIGLSIEPVRRLHLGLDTEVGYAARPVYGVINTERTVSLSGVWLGLRLAIGVVL
jgi:hypothetical protein